MGENQIYHWWNSTCHGDITRYRIQDLARVTDICSPSFISIFGILAFSKSSKEVHEKVIIRLYAECMKRASSCQPFHLCCALSYLPKPFSYFISRQWNSLNKSKQGFNSISHFLGFNTPSSGLLTGQSQTTKKNPNKFWITTITEVWACHFHSGTQKMQTEKSDKQMLSNANISQAWNRHKMLC